MASPAYSQNRIENRVGPEGRWTKVPDSFIENQALLIPAERAVALAIFKRAGDLNTTTKVSSITFERWTGLQPRQIDYALKGLQQKGLVVNGRGTNAEFSWDWTRWNAALKTRENFQSPNPKPKERTAEPNAKIHEECHANGCTMLRQCHREQQENTKISPLFVIPVAHCTAQSEKQAPQKTTETDTEKAWPKTLSVMRAQSLTLGVSMLIRVLAVIQAMFGKVADGVLSHAVAVAFKDRGKALEGNFPLLLKIVPEVLAGMKQRGVKLDTEVEQSPPGELKPSDQEIAQARDILRDEESGRYKEPDIEWAREVLNRLLLSERGHSDKPQPPKKKRARDLI